MFLNWDGIFLVDTFTQLVDEKILVIFCRFLQHKIDLCYSVWYNMDIQGALRGFLVKKSSLLQDKEKV